MDFDPQKNYYDILGVEEWASEDEIKKAFRKQAVKHHPDRKWGNKEKFQAINEAHGVLSDQQKRQQYDMYRKWWFSWWWFWWGGFGWWFSWWWFDIGDLVGDLFGSQFGWWWRSWPQQWQDIQLGLTITFDDAYLWVEKTIKYSRNMIAEGVETVTCNQCDGRWSVAQQARTPFGVMQVQQPCPTCSGLGSLYEKDGKTLWWWWLEEKKDELNVKVPAWINHDVYLKYVGRGHEWAWWWPAGDLYIKIKIAPQSYYVREGNDLYVNQEISIYDCVLWGEMKIKHPEWEVKVKIPKWTQPDDLIRVSNKWFGKKWLLSSRGDMLIKPTISIPKRLSKDEEKLWKQLKKS